MLAVILQGKHEAAELTRLCAELDAYDDLVRARPCLTLADAAAKLGSVLAGLRYGERTGAAIAAETVLAEVIAWIGACLVSA